LLSEAPGQKTFTLKYKVEMKIFAGQTTTEMEAGNIAQALLVRPAFFRKKLLPAW